jgi:hypothetical protein
MEAIVSTNASGLLPDYTEKHPEDGAIHSHGSENHSLTHSWS